MTLQLSDDKRQFIQKQLDGGISATVISRAYQRRFNAILRPLS